jgi:hypothetical protein
MQAVIILVAVEMVSLEDRLSTPHNWYGGVII